jgi:ABC-type cobalamin/Fe3+-siderophores transport system ATPase subunit
MSWTIKLEGAPEGLDENIRIVSSKHGWNDFGYNYHALISLNFKGKPIFLSGYVIPLNLKDQKPFAYLSSVPSGEMSYFISLLANPGEYKKLADQLSVEAVIFLLNALHEVSYDRSVGAKKFEHIIQTEPFRLGVLRYQDAYLALISGAAGAYVQAPMGDAKVPFNFTTLLPGTENFVTLDVAFRDHKFFDDRVHCLIGVNGTGKTNLLARLAVEAASVSNYAQEGPPTILLSDQGVVERFEDSTLSTPEGFRFNRVVSYYSDPSSSLPRFSKLGCFEYHAFNTTSKKESSEFHQNLSYLLVTLLRLTDDAFAREKSRIFNEVLSGFMPMHLLAIPVTADCPSSYCVKDITGNSWSFVNQIVGEQRSLDILGTIDTTREPSFLTTHSSRVIDMSSGQRSMFHFALHFLNMAGDGTLLIIDEPETYLHPNLVSDYMMLLYNILERTSSIAIIATHSAYVVREVPTHCVHILERKGKKAIISRPYLQTLGANVAEISLAVFGDSTVDAYHRKVSESIAKANMPFEQIVEVYQDIFNVDMLMEIKDRISNPREYD